MVLWDNNHFNGKSLEEENFEFCNIVFACLKASRNTENLYILAAANNIR